MSKKAAVLIVVFGMIGAVNAVNLVVNGDFEQLPGGTGWTQWWGGNSNRYVTDPVEGDHCAGVWWHDDGIIQTLTVGPGKYEFGGKLMTTQGMVNRRGVIQVEFGGFIRQLDIVPGDAVNVWYVAKPQEGIPDSSIANITTPGENVVTINLMMVNLAANPTGIVFYDDIYFGPLGVSKEAKFPHPYEGEIVPPSLDVLRWTNPEPNAPGDVITCDVYLEADDGDPNFISSPIAGGIAANSVTLSQLVPPQSLLPNTKYYWRVDCTDPFADPNTGGPVMTQGPVWTFTTLNDNPPVVNAGPDKYLWLDMADGDGDSTKVTFALDGQLIDDGKSQVALQWSLIYSEQDPATSVTIVNPNQAVTFNGTSDVGTAVTINGTGFFRFQLAADDAYAHDDDIVEVIVYATACEAAQGDPADHYQTYAFIGDANNDCKVDMDDLSIMAATWLDCLSDKLGCTP